MTVAIAYMLPELLYYFLLILHVLCAAAQSTSGVCLWGFHSRFLNRIRALLLPISAGQCRNIRHIYWRWWRSTLGARQILSLNIDFIHQFLNEWMIEFTLCGIEELLMLQEAIITFLIFKCLHNHIESVQVFDKFRFSTFACLVFL